MRRLRVQIWDETNEAEHWAPVSLTGKFRYYVLLSASNRCRTSPLWVGHIAHKQDQEEACDCSILCVSSKPSVSLLILNISWTILDDAGVPHFKKKTYYHWWRLGSSVRTTESLFLGAVKSMAEVLPPASSSQDAAIAEAAAAITGFVQTWGSWGRSRDHFVACPETHVAVIHWVPLCSTGRRIAGRDCRGCDILGLNPRR
jgi:hypothetical protein